MISPDEINYLKSLPDESRRRLGFYNLYSPPAKASLHETVSYLEKVCLPTKSMPSESSHHYLINDASHSIRQYLGLEGPNNTKLKTNTQHFDELQQVSTEVNAIFKVFSVPEKYTVYPELLPRCLVNNWLTEITFAIRSHPSWSLDQLHPYFINTAPYIISKKGFGDLYYHGDTHMSSLGALQLLNLIEFIVLAELGVTLEEIPTNFSRPCLGSWLGDLGAQTPDDLRADMILCFQHNKYLPIDPSGIQNTSFIVHFPQDLPSEISSSSYQKFLEDFKSPSRPKDIFCNPAAPVKKKLLVFRDSTATNIVPSLALLFSEVISIWDRSFTLRPRIIREVQPDAVIVISADRFICGFH